MTSQLQLKKIEVPAIFKLKTNYKTDWIGPICILLLGIIGIFFIYSVQSYEQGNLWKSQILWLSLGIITYIVVALIDYQFWLKNAHWIYWAGVLLLIPLAVQSILIELGSPLRLPFVQTRWGASRWLDLKLASLQPSEIAKVGTMMLIAVFLISFDSKNLKHVFRLLVKCFLITLLPLFLVFLEPDLGSALIFVPVLFCLMYVSNFPKKFFRIMFSLCILGLSIIGFDIYKYQKFLDQNKEVKSTIAYEETSWIPLKDYQRNRLLGFIAPSVIDPKGTGIAWNRNQSLYAIASGKITGKGLGQGTQAKLGYLPSTVATNDFIFSVIAEEAGLLGAASIIGLFTLLLLNNLRIASLSKDRFGTLLTVGITTILAIHFFINTGMTLGIMPITGLPLPFVSYGGTFLLTCFLLQGIVQSVHRLCRDR